MRRAAKLSERGGLPGGCPGPPGTRTKKLEPTAMGSIMQGARGQMRRRVVDSAEWTDRRRGAAWTDMNRARWFYTEVNSTAVQSRAEQSSVKQCCEAPAGNLASRHGSTPTARRLGDAVDLHCTALDHRPAAADKHLNSAKPPSHGQTSLSRPKEQKGSPASRAASHACATIRCGTTTCLAVPDCPPRV